MSYILKFASDWERPHPNHNYHMIILFIFLSIIFILILIYIYFQISLYIYSYVKVTDWLRPHHYLRCKWFLILFIYCYCFIFISFWTFYVILINFIYDLLYIHQKTQSLIINLNYSLMSIDTSLIWSLRVYLFMIILK